MNKTGSMDLTEGNIWKQILVFAFPVLLSNILQQVYNITNSYIVGNYVGKTALSAVSACGPIINIYTFLFYGLGMGAGIVVAHLNGANEKQKVNEAIETSMTFAIILGFIVMIVSELALPLCLRFTNVPDNIYSTAQSYLRIYFLLNFPLLVYNFIFYIARSLGNTVQTMYYLIISCFLNLLLGVLFVRVFNLSVIGTALASVISQYLVAYLSYNLLHSLCEFKVDLLHNKFNFEVAGKILALGIPAGIQNMLIAISTALIQSYVNLFPNEAIAGFGVSEKVSTWAWIPGSAVNGVIASFVGQNFGAQKFDRVKKGINVCLIYELITTAILSVLLFVFAPNLVGIFNNDAQVISYGAQAVKYMIIGYVPICFSHVYNGSCRGAGNVAMPLVIALFSQAVFRTAFVYFGLKVFFDIRIIFLSGPLCYIMAGGLAALYFNCGKWTKEHQMR